MAGFDDLMGNPMFNMGMGLLGGNTGSNQSAAFSNAMRGGMLGMNNANRQQMQLQQMKKAQLAQQALMANLATQKSETERKERERQELSKRFPGMANLPMHVQSAMLAQKFPRPGTYGTTPYFDSQGNAYQLSTSGAPRKVGAPIQRPAHFINTGSAQFPVNPITGQRIGNEYTNTLKPNEQPTVKRDQARATAAGSVAGKRDAEAVYDLPSVIASGEETVKHIDDLINHPGLEYAVGGTSVLPVIPGTPAADFIPRLQQLQGGAFLQAYQDLKGGGQITEVEGQKAEQAKARMSRAPSEDEFRKALTEYRNVIIRGVARAKAKAGAASESSPSNAAPVSNGWAIEEVK